MSSDDLDAHIRTHYEEATSRGEEAIERVRKTVEAEAQAVAAGPAAAPKRIWRWSFVVAAAAVLGLAAGIGITQSWVAESRLERVAQQVAFNYAKKLPDDFSPPPEAKLHYEQLQFILDREKLGFLPVKSSSNLTDGFQLKGVRYCTLGDRIGIQLRLENTYRYPLMLYQFAPSEVEADLTEERIFKHQGVAVRLWKEQGLVMGLSYYDVAADSIPSSAVQDATQRRVHDDSMTDSRNGR